MENQVPPAWRKAIELRFEDLRGSVAEPHSPTHHDRPAATDGPVGADHLVKTFVGGHRVDEQPDLRSTGAPRDLRKDTPYLSYGELEFEIPVGIKGDNYDRYYVRMREIDESKHMIRQLIDLLQPGPVSVDDRRCTLPDKQAVYTEIEALIHRDSLTILGLNT